MGSSDPCVSEDTLALPPPCTRSSQQIPVVLGLGVVASLSQMLSQSRETKGNVKEASGGQLLATSGDRG